MSAKISIELGDVQKTLFLPLYGRALETQKAHPLLSDPTAVRIIESVSYDFSTIAGNVSELSLIAWITRSRCTDAAVRQFLQTHPRAAIVNVGCGLDTTFERVDNGTLRWYDLDLPDVIALRRKFIPETPRRTFIASSFLEEDWLKHIEVTDNVFFIVDGVFYYFSAAEVRAFFLHLVKYFPGSELFCDLSSPFGVKVANKQVISNTGLDEKSYLTWGIRDPRDILRWDPHLQILAVLPYFHENPGQYPLNVRLIGAFSDLMKIQYMVHFKILS
jgi:O-methyltransferase involved in polyketide biosynthesis